MATTRTRVAIDAKRVFERFVDNARARFDELDEKIIELFALFAEALELETTAPRQNRRKRPQTVRGLELEDLVESDSEADTTPLCKFCGRRMVVHAQLGKWWCLSCGCGEP